MGDSWPYSHVLSSLISLLFMYSVMLCVNYSHKQELGVTAHVSLLKAGVGSCLSSSLSQPLLSESSFFQGEVIADEDVQCHFQLFRINLSLLKWDKSAQLKEMNTCSISM